MPDLFLRNYNAATLTAERARQIRDDLADIILSINPTITDPFWLNALHGDQACRAYFEGKAGHKVDWDGLK